MGRISRTAALRGRGGAEEDMEGEEGMPGGGWQGGNDVMEGYQGRGRREMTAEVWEEGERRMLVWEE